MTRFKIARPTTGTTAATTDGQPTIAAQARPARSLWTPLEEVTGLIPVAKSLPGLAPRTQLAGPRTIHRTPLGQR